MVMTYAEKLKDPRWQKKRLQLFEAAGWACESCETKEVTLHVHHKYYRKGASPWDYPDDALQVLCKDCHLRVEQLSISLKEIQAKLGEAALDRLIGYAKAVFMDQERAAGEQSLALNIDTLSQKQGFADYFDADSDDLDDFMEDGIIRDEALVDISSMRSMKQFIDGMHAQQSEQNQGKKSPQGT